MNAYAVERRSEYISESGTPLYKLRKRNPYGKMYSVMQSDRNRFCGDVVLDSFNMAYRDEGYILYKTYEKQIFWDLYYEVFWFLDWLKKMHT